jgi:hypothetical protein
LNKLQQEELTFSQAVPALGHIRIWKDCSFNCKITKVLRHWPNGCNGLVGIAIGVGTRQIWPETGTLAINDATLHQEYMDVPARAGDQMWVDITNTDAANPHTPVATLFIEEEEG